MKTLISAALLTLLFLPASLLRLPAAADAPASATVTAPAAAPLAPLVPGSAAAALDALAGKPQIVGITTKKGVMFLGRVISGDHTNYLVQAFHFVGRPQTVSRTYGSGRNRRVVRTQVPTYIPDVKAVEYLLAGAAGSRVHPAEVPAGSGTLAASDIKWLQAISPPTKAAIKAAKKPKLPTPAASVPTVSVSASPVSPGASSSPAAATAASPWSWTMTTLWPPVASKSSSKSQ